MILEKELNVDKEFDVIGFGEVMLRLSPPDKERISQGEVFEKKAGGSELNVVSGISLLGLRTGIVTKLPDNEIGKFVKNKIRFYGVSDDYLVYDTSSYKRLGVYFYESGAHPRKPTVVYDRHASSITNISLEEVDPSIYNSTKVFHVSGISLALNESVRQVVIEMIKKFKENGVLISFDVNYRASLWDEDTARETITSILPYIDILFVSEETSRRMLQQQGTLEEIMKNYSRKYGTKIVATTMRKVLSPTRHTWNSKIYSAPEDKFFEEEPYEEIEVIDRIGSGDAYLAGALFGIIKFNDLQKALEFGNAMAAIKNTVPGDMPACDFNEISGVIKSHKKDGVDSEMNR
ncbi:sugar kinase [Petroclostridium sp. X23]|uniref:sugar kinase n=1 Tax=Petroclostridium sp. X23 TaxID=3045146 RepID=UPI0024AD500D|nr:sugar kinase [Petroclostridium sp. X23]WHH60287.1 sugar kinase [Petroclostridium sp. X23]